jgi:LmbE family N-acetylglucosaminyl deacetylase
MMRAPAAVIVAHPDDEALWLSSVVASVDRVVFCFGSAFERPRLSAARRRAVAALPLAHITDLAVPESGVHHEIDSRAAPTAAGIEIADPRARARYEENFARLSAALPEALAGVSDVYTHNPWGEYGHPEHIQVHRVLAALQPRIGFALWFSNYVGRASWPLARRLGAEVRWTQRRLMRTDRAHARRLMRIYREHRAWTWNWAHSWPAHEALYALAGPSGPDCGRPLSGEWLLDVGRLRWWSPLRPFARRRLLSTAPVAGGS